MLSVKVKHPDYVIMSSDFSQQEPKLTAFMSGAKGLIESFQQGKDIYSTIASIAFQLPYEDCCEFNPVTGEKQPEGKERRSVAKVIVLGLNYGMSTASIGQDVFAHDDTMTDEEKTKRADEIFDAVMTGFPELNNAIKSAQYKARTLGYTETMLGRRRHHPNMQLPYFEFEPMKGYVNPDIDPLDPDTMQNRDKIPARIIESLNNEFDSYQAKNQYWKISKRTKELAAEQIKVINNTKKITEASRQVWNCVTKDTEILTTAGWKRYNEVSAGDKVLSYSIERQLIEEDTIQAIHIYNEPTEVVEFKSPTFSAASTRNHRWVVCTSKETPHIKTTQDIERHKWSDFPILRVGNNKFSEYNISDDELKLLGWVLTDGSTSQGGITLSQSTTNPKNAAVYKDMITTLDKLGLEYTDHVHGNQEHSIYLGACDYTKQLAKAYEHRVLKPELVSNLSQRQCRVLMQAMLQGDGQGVDGTGAPVGNNNAVLTCNSQEKVDIFQYLVFRAGYASSSKKYMPEDYNQSKSANTVYESVGNTSPIRMKNPCYAVTVYNIIRAHIYEHHKHSMIAEDGVWCVSTSNQTWVARRDGKVYITGNSVIQGSAADLTKMAMLRLVHNDEWRKIGGRFLTPVHDELIVEVPYVFREDGAAILKDSMEGAGSFLPFVIKCDIEQTLRWYGVGLDEILEFDKPTEFNWDTMTESNIKWLQCMLLESEYILPTFARADGKKLDGIEAKGVNGIVSEDMKSFCLDYMHRYGISEADFIDHIHRKVMYGVS